LNVVAIGANMSLFENPIALARQVADLSRAVSNWQKSLRRGDIDASGPFVFRPTLTERDAFREIRETTMPEPVRRAWTRWAFWLTEARVNAGVVAQSAHAYRVERQFIETPEPLESTLHELLRRMLERPSERSLWGEALASRCGAWQRLTVEASTRRHEIARRAGFAHADEIATPFPELLSTVEQFRAGTDEVYRAMVPRELGAWLDAALAMQAAEGWPAQLTPRSVRMMLGPREWTAGLELTGQDLGGPLSAASYARALYHLGSALVEAAAPAAEPFVLSHDPYGLYRNVLGALLANLTGSAAWQRDTLGVSRSRALDQSRALSISQLIHLRCCGLVVELSELARRGYQVFLRDFSESSARHLGFVLPSGFAGVVPRLRSNAGQRFLGPLLAMQWARELVTQYDEDWYRNPRGIEAVRSKLATVLPTSVEADAVSSAMANATAAFNAL
jgi:hypothetical protein